MAEETPNIGKQFEEIMGKNFTPKDETEMTGNAVGQHLFDKVEGILGSYRGAVEKAADQRMALFPEHMMSIDEDGRHVSYTSPKGWTHKWYGGTYIEHHHPKAGPVDVTNVEDREGNLPTMAPEEFLKHTHDFETESGPDHEAEYGKL